MRSKNIQQWDPKQPANWNSFLQEQSCVSSGVDDWQILIVRDRTAERLLKNFSDFLRKHLCTSTGNYVNNNELDHFKVKKFLILYKFLRRTGRILSQIRICGCGSGKIIRIVRIRMRNPGVAYPVGVVLAHEAAYVVRSLHQQPSVTHLLLLWVTWQQKTLVFASIGHPDPDVFGPPGSGSIGQRYGFGSGSFLFIIKVLSGLK